MKRLILITGSKGGTGKSTFDRALADRLRRTIPDKLLLLDGDDDVGTLLRHYGAKDSAGNLLNPQPLDGVLPFYMLGGEKDRDTLINMLGHGRDVVLADLPGGSLRKLREMESDSGLMAIAERCGYRVTFVNVIEGLSASTRSVSDMIRLGGRAADYVVVVNSRFGDRKDFLMWYGSPVDNIEPSPGIALLAEHNGVEIQMPVLGGGITALIDFYKLTYTEAGTDPRLQLGHQSRALRWLHLMDAELDKAGEYLGLTKKPAKVSKLA